MSPGLSVPTPDVSDATVWMRGDGYQLTDDYDSASSVAIRSNLAVDAMGVAATLPPAAELKLPESEPGSEHRDTVHVDGTRGRTEHPLRHEQKLVSQLLCLDVGVVCLDPRPRRRGTHARVLLQLHVAGRRSRALCER